MFEGLPLLLLGGSAVTPHLVAIPLRGQLGPLRPPRLPLLQDWHLPLLHRRDGLLLHQVLRRDELLQNLTMVGLSRRVELFGQTHLPPQLCLDGGCGSVRNRLLGGRHVRRRITSR